MAITQRVASLTDEQVIEEYGRVAESDQDLEGVMENVRSRLERDIHSDEDLSDTQKTTIIERLLDMIEVSLNELRADILALYQQYYTVDEMRILLSFREEYPVLSQKSRDGAKKGGELIGKYVQNLIQGSMTIFMEVVDEY